ncbi:lipid-A-disaccharide synthase [Microvirga sp. W0021]|uniref:Lipid-A-disaccharide synthase n=1 Tax=Hohaiivirga grylli TaxID=3133970 RepID=A0ABV0BJM4_9HYPH
MTNSPKQTRRIFIVAGEESGDQLGGKLMRALKAQSPVQIEFQGVGGQKMIAEGIKSLFPLEDIAVMGFGAVVARLRLILARIKQTAEAVIADNPDVLVIIDSPDFTHRVAKRVRQKAPHIPIVDYVSPSVWAWRPGRAKKMRAYVDHVMAILPFEPAAHKRLDGPPCSYVGHPLIERISEFRPKDNERKPIDHGRKQLIVLPGSRRSEVSRLMEPFGEAVALLDAENPGGFDVIIPAVAHHAREIEERSKNWRVQPKLVFGEEAKLAAFRGAHAALAASGTVTLELALSKVPMVVGYKVSKFEEQLRFLVKVESIVLANLVLQNKTVPEFIQQDCTPEKLSAALRPLLSDTPERQQQLAQFDRLDDLMGIGGEAPSERAARIVLETAR